MISKFSIDEFDRRGLLIDENNPVNRMHRAGLIALLLMNPWLCQTEWPADLSSSINLQSRQFIAAFELSEDNGFVLAWPFASMQRAPYDNVLVVAEKMPRIRKGGSRKKSVEMVAARSLKFNGRHKKPYRSTNGHTYFLVRLDNGRLKLSISIPPGLELDPEHKVAHIKLYRR